MFVTAETLVPLPSRNRLQEMLWRVFQVDYREPTTSHSLQAGVVGSSLPGRCVIRLGRLMGGESQDAGPHIPPCGVTTVLMAADDFRSRVWY